MKRCIEIHQPKDERQRPMYVYVIDGQEVSPYFFSRTVCEAYMRRYDELAERLTDAKASLAEYKERGCMQAVMQYTQYLIPQIEDDIHRFFQDVSNGVFEKQVLHIKN